jgi:hypothetical protein
MSSTGALTAVGLGSLLALSGCGVTISRSGDYYFSKAVGGYPLNVTVVPGNMSVRIEEVTALVGRSRGYPEQIPMARSTVQPDRWTALYTPADDKGLYVKYRVRYRSPTPGPLSRKVFTTTIPSADPERDGYLFPILARDADTDGDGEPDRSDSCPFTAQRNCANIRRIFLRQDFLPASPVQLPQTKYKTEMQGNRGSFIATLEGRRLYSFDQLVVAQAELRPSAFVSGTDLRGMVLKVQGCSRVFDDAPGGYESRANWPTRFLQVYAAADGFPCTWTIASGGVTLLQGTEVLIFVSTITSGQYIGSANLRGRATLLPPPAGAPADARELYRALTAGSDTGYVYFYQYGLQSLVPAAEHSASNRGYFSGQGYLYLPADL